MGLVIGEILKTVISNLKNIAVWIYKWYAGETPVHRRDAWIVLLILCLYPAFWFGKHKSNTQYIASGPVTVLLQGAPQKVTIYQDRIVYVPQGGGPTSIIGKWPDEPVKIDDKGIMTIQHYGLCLLLGIGGGSDLHGMGPAASVRFIHARRFGVSASVLNVKDKWLVGPGVDARLPIFTNCRFGLNYNVVKPGGFGLLTVDLR